MPISTLMAFRRTPAGQIYAQMGMQHFRCQQVNLHTAFRGQRRRNADGPDLHIPRCACTGVLQEASLEKREANRHRRMNARLMRLTGVRVQTTRDVRGHDHFAAAIRCGNQLRIGATRGSRGASAEQRIQDAAALGKVQPIPAVYHGRKAHGCSRIALQGGLAGERLRRHRINERDGDAGLAKIPCGGEAIAAVVALADEDEPSLGGGIVQGQRMICADLKCILPGVFPSSCISAALSTSPPAQRNDLLCDHSSRILHQRNSWNPQPLDCFSVQPPHLLSSYQIHGSAPFRYTSIHN
ncbi:hypothetical protein D3C71_1249140 [compost metagenome]